MDKNDYLLLESSSKWDFESFIVKYAMEECAKLQFRKTSFYSLTIYSVIDVSCNDEEYPPVIARKTVRNSDQETVYGILSNAHEKISNWRNNKKKRGQYYKGDQ